DPTMPGQHVDGGPATKEIEHHLVSDFGWIRAYTFGGYTVVRRDYVYPLLLNAGRDRFCDCGNSSPNLLEVSEAARRVGQAKMTCRGSGEPALVDRFDRLAYFIKEIHIQPLRCNTNDEPSDVEF